MQSAFLLADRAERPKEPLYVTVPTEHVKEGMHPDQLFEVRGGKIPHGREEEEGRKIDRHPRARQALGKSGRRLLLLLLFGQNWLCVDAAAEGLQRRTEMMKGMRQQEVVEEVGSGRESTWRQEPEGEAEVPKIIIVLGAVRGTKVDLDGKGLQVKQMEKIPRKWKRPKGDDRTEMRREEKRLRCTLLSGSAWSTERKYMMRYKGKCDIFFGIEHRLRKEEMEEQFNKEAKEGWRFAASAARITEETTGSEDRKAHVRSGCGSRRRSD